MRLGDHRRADLGRRGLARRGDRPRAPARGRGARTRCRPSSRWSTPIGRPPAWGRSTVPALEAGVFWATVGAIRALVDGQAEGLSPRPWVVWSGGDAELLMGPTALDLPDARLAPSLVLDGLRAACEA